MLPLTYDECRARFRRSVRRAGLPLTEHPIAARGPFGQELTVDVCRIGADRPRRALIVMSGVHGVEGFIGSALQCDLIDRGVVPRDGDAIVCVHAVNPWGMAWWRRQNESNVDLNRNWARDRVDPPANPGYAEVHHLLCPDDPELPTPESLLEPMRAFVERHGIEWVRAAVSAGQYSHPDGLYFGGDRLEESTAILEAIVTDRLGGAELALSLDLHTGHGRYGEPTLLSAWELGSDRDRWLRDRFDPDLIEATAGNPDATAAHKAGQLAPGFAELLPGTEYHAVTLEIGTVSNTPMVIAERAEHWVHRHGDRSDPAHQEVVDHHRACSTPDDPAWAEAALGHGRRVIDDAVAALG